jgi:methionine synthase I (cobalamin-dependent)
VAAALPALSAAGRPFVVTLTLAERARRLVLPDGGDPVALLARAVEAGAAAVGVNCVEPGPALTALVAALARALPVPLVVKPSPGPPGQVASPRDFAEALRPACLAGATLVGGCCGATAGHLAALGALLQGLSTPRG